MKFILSLKNTDKMQELSKCHLDICKASEYLANTIFRSMPTSSNIPPHKETFYIRTHEDKTVYEIERESSTGQLKWQGGVQGRAFIPWDRGQLWCFLPVESNKGLLIHAESSNYLTVVDGNLTSRNLYDYNKEAAESHLFEYTTLGEWIHVQSGYKLFYQSGCGSRHDTVKVNYKFDIIPAKSLMFALNNENVCWSNTNCHESI